jgi:amino acid transporter
VIFFLLILLCTVAMVFTVLRLRALRGVRNLKPVLAFTALTLAIICGPALTHTSAAPWSVLLLAEFAALGAVTGHELRLRHNSPAWRAYRDITARRQAYDELFSYEGRHRKAADLREAHGTHGKGPRRNVS